ncbi:alpha/beta fold hydrolase [Variovorax sp. E3]|uniref:alpha/beta fold hydrolase n=1 Tax=Variovorax sp. E3 TaxID=1914993 RepID=UPI0018DEA918|nr:alpha/beta fold hydrolase [Variovorax sp. E3]
MYNSTQYHEFPDFQLASGRTLPARIAYVTLGELNDQRDNVVLVAHGFTSSHRFILPDSVAAEGSWAELIGPGKAIDTNRYFVVSSNALGSSYGTTGAADIDVATGGRFGCDFPEIGFSDIAALQHALLQSMGVTRLRAVVGVSMGGFQAWQWAVQYPDVVERVGVILSAFCTARGAAALEATLATDGAWNGGHPAAGAMAPLLARIRADTLRRYGMGAWLEKNGMTDSEIDAQLQAQARAWACEFDPCALLVLRRAMDAFDVRPCLNRIQASVLLVLSTTDVLFPASSGPEMVAQLQASNVRAKFHVLDSAYGHLASGLDWQKWRGVLKDFIDGSESRADLQ